MHQTEHQYTNHLITEASPYLQQHAHNPVDWYPWGEAALARARAEDKPIFLSIGYSTCHWCHVMEKEVFEQEVFAPLFNDHFICIKVDREERPDLDHIYMNFTHALNGQGGWPMNLFLTPELEPFYAATYIPPRASGQSPGITEVLDGIRDAYANQKGQVAQIAASVIERVKAAEEQMKRDRQVIADSVADDLLENLKLRYDQGYHGFGMSPKFPTPQNLLYLLQYSRLDPGAAKPVSQAMLSDDLEETLEPYAMVRDSLEAMYRGGIYDHVGGGLSRYSVDRAWLIPHFEKMLYDNAFLMETAALAFEQEPLPMYRRIYDKTLAYLKERLSRADGLFYSAEDADSEGVEGKFYAFTEAEIDQLLGERSETFKVVFHVTSQGGFEGKNILNLVYSDADVLHSAENEYQAELDIIKGYRDQRIRPHRDEKILFAWNAMAVRALAIGARVFGDDELLSLAKATMTTLLDEMDSGKGLHTSMRDDIMGPKGILDDYAYGAHALLALYETSQEPRWLLQAMDLAERTIRKFYDETDHGFHLSEKGNRELIMNPVDPYDSAIPSGNGIMTKVLLELGIYSHDPKYRRLFEDQLERFSGVIIKASEAVPTLVEAWLIAQKDQALAIITGSAVPAVREKIKQESLPRRIQILTPDSPLRERIEFLAQLPVSDDTVLYLCTAGACSLPRII